jgi:hypothetical protein
LLVKTLAVSVAGSQQRSGKGRVRAESHTPSAAHARLDRDD